MKTIEKEWKDFSEKVISNTASKEQIEDMESTFYAGALTVFNLMHKTSKMTEDNAFKFIDLAYAETFNKCKKYAEA